MPASTVCVVRLKVTGQPAWACRPRAQNSSAWAIDTVSRWSDGIRSPSSGKRSRRRASKPDRSAMATSAPSQRTMAWMAVWRLHKLGPRRARMRETSMTRCSLLFYGRTQRLLGLDGQQVFRLGQVEAKGLDAGGDDFLCQAQRPAGGDCCQHVGDVLGFLGFADQWHVAQAADAGFVGASTQDDASVGHRDATLAGGKMLGQLEAGRIGGKEDYLAVAQFGKVGNQRVGGIEDSMAGGQHHIDLGAVDRTRGGVVLAAGRLHIPARQVFGVGGDVGDNTYRAAVVGQPLAEDDFRAVFDDGGLDGAVEQQAAAGRPVRGVGFLHLAAVLEQAVAAGQAGVGAGQVEQVGDQFGDGGFAVRARHTNQRNAAGLLLREQVINDGLTHRAGFPNTGLDVHEQAWAGVDFDDGAALSGQRLSDIAADQIDASDVEADDTSGQRGDGGRFGMHFVGAIESVVGVALDQHFAAGGWHGVAAQALAFQFDFGGRVDLDDGQRMQLGIAPARVVIDLGVDQFLHGVLAVAGYGDEVAAVGGDQLAADNQQAVLDARDGTLDQHAGAFLDGNGVGLADIVGGGQVDEYAASVVAVSRLDDDRVADVFGGFHCIVGILDFAAFRHRHANRGNQLLGQVLVTRDGFGNGAGLVAFGRPDATHGGAVPKLDKVAVVEQADVRNLARFGGIDDGGGRWPEVLAVHLAAQRLDGLGNVERVVVDGGQYHLAADFQRQAGAFLVEVADHQFIDAARRGFAGSAETIRQAGHGHQFKDDMLQDMAGPRAFLEAAQEAAAFVVVAAMLDQAGQPGFEALVEAGNLVRRVVFQLADIDPGLDTRRVGPEARPL